MLAAGSLRIAATSLVDPAGRLAVNGLISTTNNLARYAVGPVLGGLVAPLSSPGYAFLIDGGSFAALLMAVCVAVPSRPASAAEPRDRVSGLQILRRLPAAARMLIVVFCFNLFYMPTEIALPLLVREQLHGTGTALGWVWAGFGVGAVVGALATNMLRRYRRQRLLVLIIGGWALAVLLLAMAPTVSFAVAAFGLGGLIYSPFTAISHTYVQSLLSGDDQQPVITLWTAGSMIAAPVGLIIGGGIVAAAGARGGLVVSALLTAALAPVAAIGLHRRRTAAVG
jgi:predicted MFS family arabinose efflux permease